MTGRMKTISDRTKVQIIKVIGLLQKEGRMHVRGISRALGMHPMTVSRIIDGYLTPFLEINEINEFGLKIKLVKIREDKEKIAIEDVLKYLDIKKRIRHNKTY